MVSHEDLVEKYTDENGELHETKEFLDQDAVSYTDDEEEEAMQQFEETGCTGCWNCQFCPAKYRCL